MGIEGAVLKNLGYQDTGRKTRNHLAPLRCLAKKIESPGISDKHVVYALALLFGFAVFFTALRSTDMLAVDGNYRCLEVWHRQSLFFGSNRHLLYPVNVLLWIRLLSALGLALKTPLRFLAAVDVMNALAAAVCLAGFFLLLHRATRSSSAAALSTLALGLSSAFLAGAINGNEPMMGLMWAVLALWLAVEGSVGGSAGRIFLAGGFLVLSLATYQSMALFAPVVLFVFYRISAGNRVRGAALLVSGTVTGVVAIYGPIYWLLGARTPSAFLLKFLTLQGRGFFDLSASRLLTLPLGIASGLTGLLRYERFDGLSAALHGGPSRFFVLLIFPILFCTYLGLCLLFPIFKWKLLTSAERLCFSAAGLGLVFSLIPSALWDPTYDKLLMQPTVCILLACGVSLAAALRLGRRKAIAWTAAAVCVLAAGTSIPWAWRIHARGTPELATVARFASSIAPGDLVVGDWDPVSTLYSSVWVHQHPNSQDHYDSVWANNGRFFSFTTEAQRHGADSLRRLRIAVSQAEMNGGQVYFVNVLDITQGEWERVFTQRFGLPYSSLALYRADSRTIERLPVGGGSVAIRLLDRAIDESRPRPAAILDFPHAPRAWKTREARRPLGYLAIHIPAGVGR